MGERERWRFGEMDRGSDGERERGRKDKDRTMERGNECDVVV